MNIVLSSCVVCKSKIILCGSLQRTKYVCDLLCFFPLTRILLFVCLYVFRYHRRLLLLFILKYKYGVYDLCESIYEFDIKTKDIL